MKIKDIRCGWSAEGSLIATLPANEAVSDDALYHYYGLDPEHRNWANYKQAIEFDRAVLVQADGRFAIVPLNPAAFEVE
jgi:hypothetical protein